VSIGKRIGNSPNTAQTYLAVFEILKPENSHQNSHQVAAGACERGWSLDRKPADNFSGCFDGCWFPTFLHFRATNCKAAPPWM
jgi:hypothetical protein